MVVLSDFSSLPWDCSRLQLKQNERSGVWLWDSEGYTTFQNQYLLLSHTQERRSSLLSPALPWFQRATGENSFVPIPPQYGAGVGVTFTNNYKAVAES